jgi:Spy/CpxP family protein refolding chaperone
LGAEARAEQDFKNISTKLKLTEEQKGLVHSIMQETAQRYIEAYHKMQEQLSQDNIAIGDSMRRRIVPLLTPEQRLKFNDIRRAKQD